MNIAYLCVFPSRPTRRQPLFENKVDNQLEILRGQEIVNGTGVGPDQILRR
jgi:hypothetical protein